MSGFIAKLGPVDSVLAEIKARQARQADLRRELDGLDAATRIRSVDRRRLERVLGETLANGHALLARPDVPERRQMLRKVLHGRLRFTPQSDRRGRRYTILGQATLIGKVAAGVGRESMVTSGGGARPRRRDAPSDPLSAFDLVVDLATTIRLDAA